VIDALFSILKPIDAPGSIPFLLLAGAAGLLIMFVWPRNRRLGRYWFATLALLYVILALPLTARAISPTVPPSLADPRGISPGQLDALVIFDGDNRRGRVTVSRDLFQSAHPPVVWVLGLEADWIRDELPRVGVPPNVIQADFGTGTTRAQLEWVRNRREHIAETRMAIVASRLQLRRVAGMAKAMGLNVRLVSAPVDHEPATYGWRLYVPSYFALRVSRDGLYERAAMRYYQWRGWAE
jgi:hypothetical protein